MGVAPKGTNAGPLKNMADFEQTMKDFIRQTVRECLASAPMPEPELISIDKAAKICTVSKQVINDLIAESLGNGFPSIRLGVRTIKIDKRRLAKWLEAGGLSEKI